MKAYQDIECENDMDQVNERLPRYFVPGQPQHVIQRGNNRDVMFVCDDDYRFYRECLEEACIKHQLKIHAYVLMTDFTHPAKSAYITSM